MADAVSQQFDLAFSIRRVPHIPDSESFPEGRPTTAWGLFIGDEPATFDWFLGETSDVNKAEHLMRKWLRVRL